MKKHTNILQSGAAAIFGGIFIASLLPVLWVTPYVRSTGDDLNYSVGVHMALMRGEGLGGVLCAVADSVKGTWHSWQGTWSSIALFSLQPGVWGNKWYPLTVAVALLCILAGIWYFLHTVLRLLGMKRSGRWTLAFLLGTLLIQYLPNDKCGLFWWTSVAHYMVPYGITMMCMGWSLRWLESGRFRFLIGDLLGMAYLGGAGYPEVVLAAVWFFLCKGIPDLSRMCSGRCDREHWEFPAGAALDSSGYSDCPVCVEMYGHRARPVESAASLAACRCWPWNQLSGPCSCHLCGATSGHTSEVGAPD